MCLQEFSVHAVVVGHVASHVIKCGELDDRMKMAFDHHSNLWPIAPTDPGPESAFFIFPGYYVFFGLLRDPAEGVS